MSYRFSLCVPSPFTAPKHTHPGHPNVPWTFRIVSLPAARRDNGRRVAIRSGTPWKSRHRRPFVPRQIGIEEGEAPRFTDFGLIAFADVEDTGDAVEGDDCGGSWNGGKGCDREIGLGVVEIMLERLLLA